MSKRMDLLKQVRWITCCIIFSAFIVGCTSADDKIPQMAADFCNCFRPLEDSLSSESKQLLALTSKASNTDSAIENAVRALSPEKQQTVGMEMLSFNSVSDPNSSFSICMKGIEAKYKSDRTSNRKKFAEKLLKELDSKKGCEVTAAIMRIGFNQEFKK